MSEIVEKQATSELEPVRSLFRDGEQRSQCGSSTINKQAYADGSPLSVSELDALFAHVIEGNPYTHLAAIEAQRPFSKTEIRQTAVHDIDGQLIGFLAFHDHRFLKTAQALISPYAPVSVPPVHQDSVEEGLAALFGAIEKNGFSSFRLATSLSGRFFDALMAVSATRGASVSSLRRWSRAGLYFDRAETDNPTSLSSKKRKEMRRLKRRLQDDGPVVVTAYEGASLREGAQRFLALEEKGWKGEKGTAMALSPATRALFEAFVFPRPPAISCVIYCLEVAEQPISTFVTFIQNGQAYLWKTSYDSAYAQQSPSGLLLLEMIPALKAKGVMMIDSCSSNATSMADIYLPHRIEMADLLISTTNGQRGGLWFQAANTYFKAHETLRAAAKQHLLPLLNRR